MSELKRGDIAEVAKSWARALDAESEYAKHRDDYARKRTEKQRERMTLAAQLGAELAERRLESYAVLLDLDDSVLLVQKNPLTPTTPNIRLVPLI